VFGVRPRNHLHRDYLCRGDLSRGAADCGVFNELRILLLLYLSRYYLYAPLSLAPGSWLGGPVHSTPLRSGGICGAFSIGSAGFNAVGAEPKQSLDERVCQRGAVGQFLS
jgi:hypothetical protein